MLINENDTHALQKVAYKKLLHQSRCRPYLYSTPKTSRRYLFLPCGCIPKLCRDLIDPYPPDPPCPRCAILLANRN
jgi:hypothetical protein